jgi:HEAT repeat protein
MFIVTPSERSLVTRWRRAGARGKLPLVLCLLATPAAAQPAPPQPADAQTVILAKGWTALASGNIPQALAAAQQALAEAPRSASALALAVEVQIVAGGPVAGLDAYEQWLQTKKVEEPYVLRRVATAFLQAAVRQGGAARSEALKALVAAGDPISVASLAEAGQQGGTADTLVLAAVGDDRAVQTVISQLPSLPTKAASIKALGDSRSPLAIQPLMQVLTAGRDDDRAAAAEALGRLGARQAISELKLLLNHSNFTVRLPAAAALYRLDDDSGLLLLNQLLASEHSAVRLAAAEALSVRSGGGWQEVARVLMSDPDPEVQIGAARLVAPFDQSLAEGVLGRLAQSENLAIREESGRVLAGHVVSDFVALRRLLRNQEGGTSVRAAGRLLDLVR